MEILASLLRHNEKVQNMKVTLLKNSERPAFLGDDFSISYSAAHAMINSAASKITSDGLHVALYAENSPEWACTLFGIWQRAGTAVPVDAGLPAREAAFILKDSQASLLFTSKTNLEKAQEAIKISERPIKICMLEDVEKTLLGANIDENWKIEREASDLALIVYTSGTTNLPKGVMLTFDNLQANVEAVSDEGYFLPNIRVLAMLPFHHILPLVGTVIAPLYVGGSIIFPKSIAPSDISSVLQKHKATMVISVPRFYELIHANVKEKVNRSIVVKSLFNFAKIVGSVKFSRLLFASVHKKFGGNVKFWISGGAALDKEAAHDLQALGFEICEGYGMTEAAPIIAFPRIGEIKIGSCGQPLPSNEVRIIDGEITVRGRSITKGYFNRPEENEATFNNGWLYTGDLGYFDDEGYLFITGRRKEIIVLPNGKKLNPIELETQLKEKSDDIEEIGVLMYDDILQAVVRLKPEKYASFENIEAINNFVRETIILPFNRANASYRRIIRFTVTTKEFPRTRIGKLKRFQLASLIESISTDLPLEQAIAPEPESEVYAELKDFMSMQVQVPVLADSHIEMDLGLDSLGKVSLRELIKENYNIDMNEADFEKFSTLRTISEHIDSEQKKAQEQMKEQEQKTPQSAAKAKVVAWGEILKNCTPPSIPKTYFFHNITIMLAKLFFKLWYNVKVEGTENVPDEGPVIIAPNHQSLCDGFLFASAFTRKKVYKFYFFAKMRAMMKSSLMRFFVRHSNLIIVDVKSNVRESVQKLAELLRKKNVVVMFPEGTRTRDGNVAEFKPMFAILSKEMEVKVVPAVISGAYEGLKSRTSLPVKGTRISFKFLPAMSPNKDESYADFAARVRDAIVAAKELKQ